MFLIEGERLPYTEGWRPTTKQTNSLTLGQMVIELYTAAGDVLPEGLEITTNTLNLAFGCYDPITGILAHVLWQAQAGRCWSKKLKWDDTMNEWDSLKTDLVLLMKPLADCWISWQNIFRWVAQSWDSRLNDWNNPATLASQQVAELWSRSSGHLAIKGEDILIV
jgi:hypothetical protein